MSTPQIRELLHEYINKTDRRLINLMYAKVQAEMKEDAYELINTYRKILDERISTHKANPSIGLSWKK